MNLYKVGTTKSEGRFYKTISPSTFIFIFILLFYRWKNVPSDLQSRSSSSASSSIYDSMAETMSDLSQSYYSLKRNSIQTKNFNNNDSSNNMGASKPKYTIKTYNNKGGGDSANHSTTTTITATTSPRERSVDTYNERSVDTQPQATHRITTR